MDVYGFITSSQPLKFDNLRDWIDWQNRNFVAYLRDEFSKDEHEPLFSAREMSIERAKGNEPMDKLGLGEILFYRDRLEVRINDEIIQLDHKGITSLSAQYMERIELFHGDLAFRFVSKKHFESGLKWELAENVIWSMTNDKHKVASYFVDLVE